jgi:predicted metal-dependent phosphoesterase TrpH
MYRIDTHVHTSEVSPCGKIGASQLVHLYKNSGYSGVVITDHFYQGYFDRLGEREWEDKIDIYMSGYRTALEEGKKVGLNVMLGIELRFTENINDYLVYGINETFLKENGPVFGLGIEGFSKLINGKDILIYQAHPYRNGMITANPELIHGVEIYNGNARHNSRNNLALKFAEDNNLKKISGSDFHELTDLARGGICVSENISTSEKLCSLLKNNMVLDFIETK